MPYTQYSPKQKRLAAVAGDKKKITQADIITLRRRGVTLKGRNGKKA
jgi:hypothetical protein